MTAPPMAPWRARAAAAIAVCGALLAGCSGAASTAGPTAAAGSTAPAAGSTASAATDAGGTPSAAPSSGTTTVTGLDGALLAGVAGTGDGMVAVGASGDRAAAWTSADGAAWELLAVDGPGGVLRAVAMDGDRGLIFGGDETGPTRVWTFDGDALGDASVAEIDGVVNAATVTDDGWLAVGDLIDAESGMAAAGAVWTSEDGTRWQQAGELALNEGTVSDVASDGATTVAVGFDVDGGKVWLAGGGDAPRAVDSAVFDAASIEGVAATDDGFIAIGRGLGDLRPLRWSSPDGRTWTRDEIDAGAFAPDLQINDLTAIDGTLMAVGNAPDGGAVWTSADGRAWTLRS